MSLHKEKLSKKELKYVSVLKEVQVKKLTLNAGAVKLNISKRQMIRIAARYKAGGVSNIGHKSRGKPSLKRLPQEEIDRIIRLLTTEYSGYNTVFAAELLQQDHGIIIHPERLRRLLIKANLHLPKRRKQEHRFWRDPKEYYGEMIQLDGSLHYWFEDRGPQVTLLAYIDDATSSVMHLRFVERESVESIMTTTRLYIEKYGKPVSFYTDRGSSFKVNNHNPDNLLKTQFERALKQLDINLIHARSPQAKGRVERSFKTLQDRLVKLLSKKKISSLDDANQYLHNEFLPQYKTKFARPAAKLGDMHRVLLPGEKLDDIFVIQETRKLNQDFTLSYKKQWFQLKKHQPILLFPHDDILVKERFNGTITLSCRKYLLSFKLIDKRPSKPSKSHKKPVLTPWFPDQDSLFCGTIKKFV